MYEIFLHPDAQKFYAKADKALAKKIAQCLQQLMEDELRPEYDLKSMSVRKLGARRCDVAGATMQYNQFESLENAEKIAALMTEGYLKERAKRGSRAKYDEILAKVPDVEPEVYDR